jgi:hypothetical protein
VPPIAGHPVAVNYSHAVCSVCQGLVCALWQDAQDFSSCLAQHHRLVSRWRQRWHQLSSARGIYGAPNDLSVTHLLVGSFLLQPRIVSQPYLQLEQVLQRTPFGSAANRSGYRRAGCHPWPHPHILVTPVQHACHTRAAWYKHWLLSVQLVSTSCPPAW